MDFVVQNIVKGETISWKVEIPNVLDRDLGIQKHDIYFLFKTLNS